ncbi:hypothetical protein DIPPA_23195 [Diplonema papillatum]|nr:hypothetical protein DIPPA_23195 [Diplonema papillatum]
MAGQTGNMLDTTGIVQLDFRLNFSKLSDILVTMNRDLTQNTKLIQILTEDFFHMRKQQDEFRSRLKEVVAKADAQRLQLEDEIRALQLQLSGLPQEYVPVATFEDFQAECTGDVKKFNMRLTEMERTSEKQMRQYVEKNVSKLLNAWYEPVKDETEQDVKDHLSRLEEALRDFTKDQINVADQINVTRIQETTNRMQSGITDVNQDMTRRLAALRSLQDSNVKELSTRIAENDGKIHERVTQVEQVTTKRFVADETKVTALYNLLCVDEAEATAILAEPESSDGDEEEDRRVSVMHNTAPFLEMRAKIQHDIRLRVQQAKEEDQDDFSKQVIELQRELKTKTSTHRVLQMIQDNMDKNLYETVDLVRSKVAMLESTKVDSEHFLEALKSKCDMKLLDLKADRAFVNSLFEFLRAKLEQFQEGQTAEVSRIVDFAVRAKLDGDDPPQARPKQKQQPHAHQPLQHGGSGKTGSDAGSSYHNLSVGADAPRQHSVHPTSLEDRAKIEAALNPHQEYQWGNGAARAGMPPSRNLKGAAGGNAVPYRYDNVRGLDSRDGRSDKGDDERKTRSVLKAPVAKVRHDVQGSTIPGVSPAGASGGQRTSFGSGSNVATWMDGAGDADDRQGLARQQSFPGSQPPATTRSHEAYVKAVAVSHHELSHALEASPPDNYVPEAMRRPHAVPLQ